MGGGDAPTAKHVPAFTEVMVLCAGPEREQVLTESNTPFSVMAAAKGAGSETGRPAFESPSSPWELLTSGVWLDLLLPRLLLQPCRSSCSMCSLVSSAHDPPRQQLQPSPLLSNYLCNPVWIGCWEGWVLLCGYLMRFSIQSGLQKREH